VSKNSLSQAFMGFTAGVNAVIDANPYAEDSKACNAAQTLDDVYSCTTSVFLGVCHCAILAKRRRHLNLDSLEAPIGISARNNAAVHSADDVQGSELCRP
jgi:hypothetical protein